MKYARGLLPLFVCLVLGATASSALAKPVFHPRVKNALGLMPTVNSQGVFAPVFDPLASGQLTPVTYHGGSVMTACNNPACSSTTPITIHTIFWDGGTNPFQGSPNPGASVPTYEGLIEQFFTDVAADSTGTNAAPAACTTTAQNNCNVFTVEPQYGEQNGPTTATPGAYDIAYSTADPNDLILDHDAYPSKADQCASPDDTAVCITDAQVQAEVDSVITSHGNSRGLHDLWYVFLPSGVDECITAGVCGTNAFGGYHSLSNVGNGVAIYAITIDPVIETGGISQGVDPQGNPDAEITADIAAHETNEAMTDPTGVGWLDPNGFEMADKCESPQRGTLLGFAGPDNAPYNQVINGHDYMFQEMWANDDGTGNPDCVQAATTTDTGLPLPQVNLTQFSGVVSGNTGSATAGTSVEVRLVRADQTVADRITTTDSTGAWTLTGPTALQHPVGDDRDVIEVLYSGTGAPAQPSQVILTGNGGNPFIEGGWMGWSDMDNGSDVETNTLTLAPCFQTGLEASPVTSEAPTDFCNTQSDAAAAPTSSALTGASVVTWDSDDNRAFQPPDASALFDGNGDPNGPGGLVNLSVPAGEPGSVSAQGSFLPGFFDPTGFPPAPPISARRA